jgi:hypothetical protein
MDMVSELRREVELTTPLSKRINDGCKPIGGIYNLDYFSAVVLTNDNDKKNAGGVPLGGFLLAVSGKDKDGFFSLDDDEVILLRVTGTAPLPNESELTQTRLAVVRDAIASGQDYTSVTDELTRNELQQSAFDCEVLGTFYTVPGENTVRFGADIDNVVSSARYHVFLPSAPVLSWICSFKDGDDRSVGQEVALGTVRFSSTQRRATAAKVNKADVFVRIEDFVSRKSAVFGMTRTGKSNTIKTLVTAIYKYGHQHRHPIGQLILDPQGEYANVNAQDGTGLRRLGDTKSHVRIYKHTPDTSHDVECPLRINFLDSQSLEVVWDMVQHEVALGGSSNAQYMAGFRSISMAVPDASDKRATFHHERNRMAFYALLHRSGISGPLLDVSLTLPEVTREAISKAPGRPEGLSLNARGAVLTSTASAKWLLDWVQANSASDALNSSWKDDIQTGELADILKAMEGKAGDSAIKRIKPFHDPNSTGEIGDLVWKDMMAGRLVVVDLSQGSSSVTKTLSERIVTTLLNRARDAFSAGEDPRPFQIVVEEAHNLFERGKKEVESDPWVRLSKEAAKYKIGMMYATQEVTGVDRRVLANTSNWLVAHLNSNNETNELAHYYDFGTWSESIRKCEDVGFVRMKTYSSKYIVPIQVAMFDHHMINDARIAADLAPIQQRLL